MTRSDIVVRGKTTQGEGVIKKNRHKSFAGILILFLLIVVVVLFAFTDSITGFFIESGEGTASRVGFFIMTAFLVFVLAIALVLYFYMRLSSV